MGKPLLSLHSLQIHATEVMDGVAEVICYGTAVVVEPESGRENRSVAPR